jgi:hypothetical protein
VGPLLCVTSFAVFPVLSLFAQNQSEVERSLLWESIALCIVGAVVLYGVFLLVSRQPAKAAVAASLVVVGFLYFGIYIDERSWWVVALWLAVLLAGIVTTLTTRRDLTKVVVALAVVAAVLVVPQATKIAVYRAAHPSISARDPRLWPTTLAGPVASSGTRPPDIYVIIPDDYARADVLKQYFHYDNSEFIGELEQRGFTVAEDGRSPYAYSELNIAALLNMDYLTKWPEVLGRTSQDFNLVKRTAEDNRAARMLKSAGYDYVHLDTDEVTFAGGNPAISPLASPDSFMNLWLSKSILRQAGGPAGFNEPAMNERFRRSVHSVFSDLGDLRPGPKPRFVVFHTLLPHDPFIFGPRGDRVTFPAGADHTGAIGMRYYVRQLQFLDRALLDSIDRIRAHAKTPPVIVLSADEGFEVNPDLVGEAAAQDIRVKGLSAFSLPGLDHPGLPAPPNTVNSLRFVFNQYLGTNYKMLPSKSHLEGDLPFAFEEIRVR